MARSALVISTALALAFALLAQPAGARQEDPGLYVVAAGQGEDGYAVNLFLPGTLTIREGDTIRWEFRWHEPHTVTFGTAESGAPPSTPSPATYDGTGFVSSDLTLGPGKTYEVRFPTAGTYEVLCTYHPYMKGRVTVVQGEAEVDTLEAVTARGEAEYDAAVGVLKEIADVWRDEPVVVTRHADGTRDHRVVVTGATASGDIQQYFPPTLTIAKGDSVTWWTNVRTPHTVTFGPFTGGLPVIGNPEVEAVVRAGPAYVGSGYWNSGLLGVDWPVGIEFTMTFASAGTFRYYCILHEFQGQVGYITVTEPPPEPPQTGSGQARHAGRSPLGAGLVAAAAALGVAIFGTGRIRHGG